MQKCHVSINWFFWFEKPKFVQLKQWKSRGRWKPTNSTESTNPTRSNLSNCSNELAIGFINTILISKVRLITRTALCRCDFSVHFAFRNFQIKAFWDVSVFPGWPGWPGCGPSPGCPGCDPCPGCPGWSPCPLYPDWSVCPGCSDLSGWLSDCPGCHGWLLFCFCWPG